MKQAMVEAFFKRYEAFFLKSLNKEVDGAIMRELYASEFIAASPLGVRAGKNDEVFHNALSYGYENYRKMNTIGMKVCAIKVTELDSMHLVATVSWRASYQKKERIDIDFDVHYLLQEQEEGLRIFGWISGNEEEVLKKYGITAS